MERPRERREGALAEWADAKRRAWESGATITDELMEIIARRRHGLR